MKIVFVYEHYFEPFDEGVKNFAYQVYQHYQNEHDAELVRYIPKLPHSLNSLLLVPRLLLHLFGKPEKLVFMPQAALTFSSLIKIWILHILYNNRLTVVGVQKRVLKPWQTAFISRLSMPRTFVLSTSMAEPLKSINIDASVVEIGIDRETYQPASNKTATREKYKVPMDKRVLLHVGHIKKSRNIDWLLEVKNSLPDLHVILVGSTATEQDQQLYEQLQAAGISVMRDYLPNIHEVYQLADIYCFPVTLNDAAMETPLSVLEAMATNLPVLTTPFGRLPEQFQEDHGYRYVSSAQDIVAQLQSGFGGQCRNRAKTERYSWHATAEQILA